MAPKTPIDQPTLCLIRHGDTDWTDAHRHTRHTDISLNARGEERARHLGARLASANFARVFTSSLVRARRTCELVGLSAAAEVNPDLVEWPSTPFREILLHRHRQRGCAGLRT
jgi:probable phosphoglycerate mutase